MKKDYIKLRVDMLNDSTYGLLPDDLYRLLINLYMLACEKDQEGLLPKVEDIAWFLHAGLEVLLDAL
ncbi:MAG: hypothetical protein MUO76_18945, partial [Anaerolineaceae bacterium]|nr:hypothetical protein [Anaerolineaceae bacterium]